MLKNLFISNLRICIFVVYLSNIDSAYHVRALVRLLDEEINAVRRELINLEKAGILKSKKEGNKVVYRVNKQCPILWDLRAIFYKESKVEIYALVQLQNKILILLERKKSLS